MSFPDVVSVNAPVASDAAICIELFSVMLTTDPLKSNVPKSAFVPSPRVIAFPAVLKVAAFVTERVVPALSVISPEDVSESVFVIVDVPVKLVADASVSVTAEPNRVTEPKFAVVASPSVIALPVELNDAVPEVEILSESVIAPFEETVSVVRAIAPRSMSSASLIVAFTVLFKMTVPKSLAALRVTSFPPASKVDVLVFAEITPVFVMSAPAVTAREVFTVVAPIAMPSVSVICMTPPVVMTVSKSLAEVRVTAAVPASMVAVPTVMAPPCVMASLVVVTLRLVTLNPL